MTQKQQSTVIVSVIVSLLILGAAYILVAKPQLAQRSENNEATVAAQEKAESLKAELVGLESKQKALPEAEKQLEALRAKFPADYQQDEWLRLVIEASNGAGVDLTEVRPMEPISPDADPNAQPTPAAPTPVSGEAAAPEKNDDFLVAQSSVTITATGSATNLERFIRALEAMKRPLLIDAVNFSGGDGARDGSVTVTGKTFLSRDLVAPGAEQSDAGTP